MLSVESLVAAGIVADKRVTLVEEDMLRRDAAAPRVDIERQLLPKKAAVGFAVTATAAVAEETKREDEAVETGRELACGKTEQPLCCCSVAASPVTEGVLELLYALSSLAE